MFPRLAKAHAVNRSAVDAECFCYGSAGHPGRESANSANLLLRDAREMTFLAHGVRTDYGYGLTPKHPVRVKHIMRSAAPFQIFRSVVQLVAVNVVDLVRPIRALVERFSDHSVKAVPLLLSAKHGGGHSVSIPIYRAFDNALWTPEPAERAGFKAIGAGNVSPFFDHLALHIANYGNI